MIDELPWVWKDIKLKLSNQLILFLFPHYDDIGILQHLRPSDIKEKFRAIPNLKFHREFLDWEQSNPLVRESRDRSTSYTSPKIQTDDILGGTTTSFDDTYL